MDHGDELLRFLLTPVRALEVSHLALCIPKRQRSTANAHFHRLQNGFLISNRQLVLDQNLDVLVYPDIVGPPPSPHWQRRS